MNGTPILTAKMGSVVASNKWWLAGWSSYICIDQLKNLDEDISVRKIFKFVMYSEFMKIQSNLSRSGV